MLREADVTTTNSDHEVVIVLILLDVESLTADQVEITLDVSNWDRDIEFLDIKSDSLINGIALSGYKLDRCGGEQVIALLVKLFLSDTKKSKVLHMSLRGVCVFLIVLLGRKLGFHNWSG